MVYTKNHPLMVISPNLWLATARGISRLLIYASKREDAADVAEMAFIVLVISAFSPTHKKSIFVKIGSSG